MELGGLHHITAISGDISLNVAFYTEILGLRLVKKTVNQDDVSAYHLFYGDKTGRPGFDMTFFDWPNAGPNRAGAGTVAAIAFGVNDQAALDWWVQRLDSFNVAHSGIKSRALDGRAILEFQDPEGQHLELVDAQGSLQSSYWEKSPVPEEVAIKGFFGVRLIERDLQPSGSFLTDALGFRATGSYQSEAGNTVYAFEVGPGGPGSEVLLDIRPDAQRGRPGIGGVHHVAFRTPNYEEHEQWFVKLGSRTRNMSNIIDRYYFKSIYFHEPGGVLFELATDIPGFSVDEDPTTLGEKLVLPPFLEPQREAIEANLRPIIPFKISSVR